MKFAPKGRCFTFEIPDDWRIEAGMSAFKASGQAYAWRPDPCRPTMAVDLLPIDSIRRPERTRAGGDFDRARMVRVLQGISRDERIPPVAVIELDSGNYSYQLHAGFHRFSASLAVGYRYIPAIIVPDPWK